MCTSCRLPLGKEKTSHLDNSTLEKEIPAEDLGIQGPSHRLCGPKCSFKLL